MSLKINNSQILWPGKQTKMPDGIIIPTHLKVLTVEEKPFVYVRRLSEDSIAKCDDEEIECPLFNATQGSGSVIVVLLFRFFHFPISNSSQ